MKKPSEGSSGAEALLHAARNDHDPTQLARAAVKRALVARLAEMAEMGEVQAPTPAISANALRRISPQLKLWIIGGCISSLAALAALGVVMATRSSTLQLPARPAEASIANVTAPPSAATPEPEVETQVETRAQAQQRKSAPASRTRTKPGPRPRGLSQPVALAPKLTPPARQQSPLLAPDAAQHTNQSALPAKPSAEKSAPVTPPAPISAPASERSAPEQPSPAPTPPSELAWMQQIQAALRTGDPRRALALSEEHEQRWPRGKFQQEREGVRAFAACQLHMPDGQARAGAFLARYPESALAPRVRAACRLHAAQPQPLTP